MPNVLRILDANANRAREALRVMEEAARFLLDDAALTAGLKKLRHDLAEALATCPALEINRDTPGDVGTGIKTRRELSRSSAAEVVIAAGKRLSEALRALEEYGKVLPAGASGGAGALRGFAPSLEALRYRGYDLEHRLHLALGTGATRQWKLCVLVSQDLCPRGDWWRVVESCVQAACRSAQQRDLCIQLREKHLDGGELLVRACRLVKYCHVRGVSVIINDRPDIALLSGADGVHLGQTDLPCSQARKLVGRQLLIGVSTANLAQARRAIRAGADYCGVGPMFPTTTKFKKVIAGPMYLRRFVRAFPRTPHLAIGGVTPQNVGKLVAAGAGGVAVSSAVCSARDPATVVRALVRA